MFNTMINGKLNELVNRIKTEQELKAQIHEAKYQIILSLYKELKPALNGYFKFGSGVTVLEHPDKYGHRFTTLNIGDMQVSIKDHVNIIYEYATYGSGDCLTKHQVELNDLLNKIAEYAAKMINNKDWKKQ